jgi:Na+-translocating ferredoxin:NAD+ oxidoreductase RnfG subunit
LPVRTVPVSASVVLAIISLLGTVAVAIANRFSNSNLQQEYNNKTSKDLQGKAEKSAIDLNKYFRELTEKFAKLREERPEKKEVEALIYKYGQPLLVAAYELQARLYDMCQ